MTYSILKFSIKNKLLIFILVTAIVGFGIFAALNISVGAVPDITNNQVQIITTSRNLGTQDVERFLTSTVELEIGNLPGVEEIRSVSKFGLSVVTVVFSDDMDTYLPRQLIQEKLNAIKEAIPAGFGEPFMGPISTGLGEIYQYTLDVKPDFKDLYSLEELRTIQDWMVKRQLSGIPGVVEINTWGGKLKQYEVALNPQKLSTLDVTAFEVLNAVEENNSIVGGGYIEKDNESYFIRGEGLVNGVEEISNIVVSHRNHLPIYVKDVAEVKMGFANRFGAITGNGEGEKVMGQIMMLKGADSKMVIENVKSRIAEVQKSLPKGIFINPIVERSELIGRTSFTIFENLILGCLIVVFVVIFLLGNFRSGLIVSSVIPLSLLFALSLMYIFGIDANLMSLGAIDFGIIIDGAVIIVEYISYKITQSFRLENQYSKHEMNQSEKDRITLEGAYKMMNSAVFGQLIIIIVFIPILSLVGVEGKMFRPMALAFCFALIGAIILCFTYVPVMSSLFIKPETTAKETISSKMMKFLDRIYNQSIHLAMKLKYVVLSLTLLMFFVAMFIFSNLGGEFVPTLDEGDFVIQPALKTGTSLSETIHTITKMEQLIMEFPEVEKVVSRIGAAEVPTDPMSMEESDVIIKLRPKKEWKNTQSKDELADLIKERLALLPGVEIEFTQPIEMRFNELLTGTRADIAIKVFGENLEVLNDLGLKIKEAVEDVEGASDVILEKTVGLPQINIVYNRDKIAQYGMNINEINRLVQLAYSGMDAGKIYEGEKQFDIVLRYDTDVRSNIEQIKELQVLLPGGSKMPLKEFADIKFTDGPAKISRDDAKRRVVVSVNVRNRDLESVVVDLQKNIKEKVNIPAGYQIKYGGQFENLNEAKARLWIVVPIALFLIFLMLYFAFKSWKIASLIYTAIPLATIGGIIFLQLRGMPFSISAGVGFIALFGIAVLNGIVMIEHIREKMEKDTSSSFQEIVIQAARERLRPVLLTAISAALGFLPMAISTSAGAEVQKPLATVVIGGLVSATLLTLIVLPILVVLFLNNQHVKTGKYTAILVLIMISMNVNAQKSYHLSDLIEISKSQAPHLQILNQEILKWEAQANNSRRFDKTEFYMARDGYNLDEQGNIVNQFGVSQNFKLPGFQRDYKQWLLNRKSMAETELSLARLSTEKQLRKYYNDWQEAVILIEAYSMLKDMYSQISEKAKLRLKSGDVTSLEAELSDFEANDATFELQSLSLRRDTLVMAMYRYSGLDADDVLINDDFVFYNFDTLGHSDVDTWIMTKYQGLREDNQLEFSVNKNNYKPELGIEYFLSSALASNKEWRHGFSVSAAINLFDNESKGLKQVSQIREEQLNMSLFNEQIRRKQNVKALNLQLNQLKTQLDYYTKKGVNLSDDINQKATLAFENQEINYLQYFQLIQKSIEIRIKQIQLQAKYNSILIDRNFTIN
ncbi:MAG TPA: CusA/CzcA family heavy metal efflux RND transporter [Saprospiraceae bacterium]|nr:CusA/CzcA family heavy metal efflux RND transporter [Saprospiraceae bacterium]